VHVHFFGTDCLSFSDGIRLRHGDVIEITAEGFGRPLRNSIRATGGPNTLLTVKSLS
jgi:hypothetical protein